MMPDLLTLRSLLLLEARLTLYMGIALLAMAVCHIAVLGAFTMLHHRMAP
jgi:hypothetical protein